MTLSRAISVAANGIISSFLMATIPLDICTTSLCIPLLMSIQVASMSWLVVNSAAAILGCMHPFGPCISLDICPGIGLQGQIVALVLVS